MTKKELRLKLGVSAKTLQNYLNKRYYEEIKKAGYNKREHLISPAVLDILFAKFYGQKYTQTNETN